MAAGADLRRWIPRWWSGEVAGPVPAIATIVTAPAELIFRRAVAVRNHLYDRGVFGTERASVPVVSVGNISVGGTGKTPLAAWVVERLAGLGRKPAVVLRGYGRDEIEVHREINPRAIVTAHPRRLVAVEEAVRNGADSVVLDDGFQHRSLFRDLDLVLIAAERWGKNRKLLPRGPWREPVWSLQRADHVLVTRKTASVDRAGAVMDELERLGISAGFGVVHLAPGGLVPFLGNSADEGSSIHGQGRILAVSSIADPLPFRLHLEALGAEVDAMVFPDHHEFTSSDLEEIDQRAKGASAVVVTRKDAVKLRPVWRSRTKAYMLEQTVVVESGAASLERSLRRAVGMPDE